LLAVAAQKAFAASLLELPLAGAADMQASRPDLSDLSEESRWSDAPAVNRLR
jgi:hypothetical protein